MEVSVQGGRRSFGRKVWRRYNRETGNESDREVVFQVPDSGGLSKEKLIPPLVDIYGGSARRPNIDKFKD